MTSLLTLIDSLMVWCHLLLELFVFYMKTLRQHQVKSLSSGNLTAA
jgi:hypothetical protein